MRSADEQRTEKLATLTKRVEAERTKLEQAEGTHKTELAKHETALGVVQQAKAAFDADPTDANADAVVKANAEASRVELYVARTSKILDDARADLAKAQRQRDEQELEMVSLKCDGTIVVAELEKVIAAKAGAIRDGALALHNAAKKLSDDAQAARRRKLELQQALGRTSEIARTEAEIRSEHRSPSAVDSLPRLVRAYLDSKGIDERPAFKWLAFL